MDDETWDVTQASEQAWTDFAARLQAYVGAMAPASWVRFTVPVAEQPEDGRVPSVQVDRRDDRVEVTVPSNRELAPAYELALPNEPTVEIFTRLAHGVRSRPQTAIELALVNREHAKVKFQLFDRDVFQVLALPAMPFVGEHLWSALEEFIAAADRVRADLTLRVGGRAA